ncbi:MULTISPECIES: HdeD family acid-resistance protein [unclassified Sinorhizobium]|uniref:HdeD family acid-resistance protein n=1 Tax=unclassified Sinorhizobium TaxID=2613772 RepID=UPI003523CA54
MTTYNSGPPSTLYVPPTWLRVLLGIVMILGGLFVLGDIALATLVSTLFIGFTAIVVGAFEIIHAFWTKGWGGFIWQLVLGILYIIFGFMVVNQPISGALILTAAFGLAFLASGLVRIILAFRHWSEGGWLMLISGLFGVLAGLVIITGWPATSLWVLGLLLGIDLISHGLAWLIHAWSPSTQTV